MYILNKTFNKFDIIDGVKIERPHAEIIPSTAEISNTKEVAALLMKNYKYKVIKLENGEKCDCLSFFKTVKAMYEADSVNNRGLYIIKDSKNEVIDFFIVSTYGHYINIKDTISNRLKKQHKGYNAPRDVKIAKMLGKERLDRWNAYITVSLKG